MTRHSLPALVLILVAGAPAFAQPTPGTTPPASIQDQKKPTSTFASILAAKFPDWDADHNGTLSPDEIDKLCIDASIKGPDAAAAAALKRVVRSERFELPPLTLGYLTKQAERRGGTDGSGRSRGTGDEDSGNTDRRDSGESRPRTGARPDGASSTALQSASPLVWESTFRSCLTRIQRSDRTLFKDDSDLTLDHCHQGPLGDCYFVSVVGAMVKRDPGSIRKMIHERSESDGGGYSVTLGGGKEIVLGPLTDAELAISSTTRDRAGDEGVWLAVLEKAFGTYRHETRPDVFKTASATDAIAKGGTTATSIRVLTGHAPENIVLKHKVLVSGLGQQDINGKQVGETRMAQAASTDELAAKVREKVAGALKAGKIAAAGTADEKQPPGINPKHAYAVLAYDEGKDTLTLWNPHGNAFPPRRGEIKEPGLENGYPTKAGVFEVPVKDFVRIFAGVSYETDEAAGQSRPRDTQRSRRGS